MTLDGSNNLGASTSAAPNSGVTLLGGTFELVGNASFTVSNGGIRKGTGSIGNVNVKGGSTMTLTSSGTIFNANLTVGDTQPGGSAGTVVLTGLTDNVTTSVAANVTVASAGTFKMTQNSATATSSVGGWRQTNTTGPYGTFTNNGTFIRDGGSADGTYPVLDFVFTNAGQIQFTPNSYLNFSRKDSDNFSLINSSGGSLLLNYGTHIAALGTYRQDGGQFKTFGPDTGGGTVFFLVQSLFQGGTLDINADSSTIGSLSFGANDCTVAGSFTLRLKVDGSTNGNCDQIQISNAHQFKIDNTQTQQPILSVTTLNAVPPAGWTYNLVVAPVLTGTFNALNVLFGGPGCDLAQYDVLYPPGPPNQTLTLRAK